MLYPLCFVAVFLSHWTLLRLPYFWDEGGYYIPAALDFFRTGALIPYSTLTNAHPPLPSILLAAWWHLSGVVVSGTRTFVCMVAAAALLAVVRLGRDLVDTPTGLLTAALTATYPIWFAQSSLAHADIFAASFTLWALALYLPARRNAASSDPRPATQRSAALGTALLFSLAALSKETSIITPLALCALECVELLRDRKRLAHASGIGRPDRVLATALPTLPLVLWYAYHLHRTGHVFGNPEFFRYNAAANLSLHRIALSLWHRLLHLTTHMNMFVASLATGAALLMPVRPGRETRWPGRPATLAIAVVIAANLLAFSVLGGALLTRYLLPLYPLYLLLCVAEWRRHTRLWPALAALTATAFVAAIFINPPYAFAPEDNLTYRDMIVLHQAAVTRIVRQFPQATVLTAWPADAELSRPDLGYTRTPIRTVTIANFSRDEILKAAANLTAFDTALLFSTKWAPPLGTTDLGRRNRAADTRFFDFHRDLDPIEAAALLHATVLWQEQRRGEWVAILRLPRPAAVSTASAAAR